MIGDRQAGTLQEPKDSNHRTEASVGESFLAEVHEAMTQTFFNSPSIFGKSQEAKEEVPKVAKVPENYLPEVDFFDSFNKKAA